jgi:hypothetical protein
VRRIVETHNENGRSYRRLTSRRRRIEHFQEQNLYGRKEARGKTSPTITPQRRRRKEEQGPSLA